MVILLSAVLALQIPAVQSLLVSRVAGKIQDNIDGQVLVGQVQFLPFNTVILNDVAVIDNNPYSGNKEVPLDTLFRSRSITARFTVKGLLDQDALSLRKIEVRDALFNFVLEDNEDYKDNLSRIFRLKKSENKKPMKAISIRRIDAQDITYRMVSYRMKKDHRYEHGIRWDDMEVNADLKGRNFRMQDKIVSAIVDNASLCEKSGFRAEELSGKVRTGKGQTVIQNLHLLGTGSDINIDEFKMSYENMRSFRNFISEVRMDGILDDSRLAVESISFFAPALHGNPLVADISSGEVHGTVNDLLISSLNFSQPDGGIRGDIEGRLSGLPDIRRFALDCNIRSLDFTTRSLGSFISCWTKGKTIDLGSFAPNERFTYRGRAKGLLSDLCIKGKVSSTAGALTTDIDITDIVGGRGPIGIDGDLSTENLDLGRIIGVKALHECSMGTRMKATLARNDLQATIDSLNISRLNFHGYDYSDIKAAGTFSQSAFNGRIVCNDPNINFLFQGLFNLSRKTNNAQYRFFASLGYADLHALNIDSREISRVSLGSINANYTRITKGDLIGNIDASDLVLEGVTGRHHLGDIHVNSRANDDRNSMNLSSAFVDGRFNGNGSILDFVKDLQSLTVSKELPSLFNGNGKAWKGGQYELAFDFHDSRDLLSFIAPGAYVADSTAIRFNITRNAGLRGSIRSPRIAFKDKYFKGLVLQLNNNEDALNCTITSDEISISRKLKLRNDAIMLYANDNNVGAGINFNNMTELENRGEIYITGDFSGSRPGLPSVKAKSLTSNIYYNGEQWRFNPAEYEFSGKDIKFNNLVITNNEQSIIVNGGLSPESIDSLNVNLSNVRLGILNSIYSGPDIQGLASGRILLTSPTKGNMGLLMNLRSEQTSISGYEAGTLRIGSTFDDSDSRFDLFLRNSINGKSTVNSRLSFLTAEKALEVNADLDGFELGYASSFLSSVFDTIDGKLSGHIGAEGPLSSLNISSENLKVDGGRLTIGYTKVPYFMNGALHIDNNGVHFDNIAIRDSYRGNGTVNGGILFDRFKNISMDTHVRMEGMECIRTTARDNSSFYGNVFGNGRVSISGGFSSLLLDIDANTVNNGSFHIPISNGGTAKGGDLLVFKKAEKPVYIDPYELMMRSLDPQTKQQNDMEVKLKLTAHPGVEAVIDIGNDSGNRLNGFGAGTISLDVRPAKDIFTINGDYTLNSGNVHFNAFNIANKEFTILNGSAIKFNGDIMDSDLDIDAQYNIKTSLANLIADTTSVTTRRNVECGINISDKLRNPKVDFSINIPDLDPTTKSRVESALSTDDKVQKQFMALLVTNNFLPDEQSGIVNNSNRILASNVADIMSNQLNSILQKLDIPLDLGLKYQSSEGGNSLFDVALSTQLFNNRVSVNGNIGNRQYRSSNDDDVVGDLDIEIKMDKSGQVTMSLFSHSADQYTNYLDNSQRNGVGVAYQKEFDSLKEFFRNIFSSRQKRQQQEIENALKDIEKVTINIE